MGAVVFQLGIFLLSLMCMIMAFSTAMVIIEFKEKTDIFKTVGDAILSLLAVTIGVYNFNLKDFHNPLLLILYIFYSIATIFLLLRLLLGVVTSKTIGESEQVEGYAYLERAELTLELETNCGLDFRKALFVSMDLARNLEFD